VSQTAAQLPTFAEFKEILVRDFGCQCEAAHQNIAYSPKALTVVKRNVGDEEWEWIAYLNDKDRITVEIALNCCRRLLISPEEIEFPD
jgi:hypothetical protein